MRRARFILRFIGALLVKYYLVAGLGLLLGVASFVLAPQLTKLFPTLRQTKYIAMVGRYSISDIPLTIQHELSLGLTTIDASGRPQLGLAESWQIAPDGQAYTFKLKPGLMWQDGQPIKSQDINYQFKDTVIDYPSESEITVKLKDPYAPLPVVVSRPVFKSGLLGAGAYRVTQIKRNGPLIESIRLSPVDRSSQLPHLVYRFYPSESQALLAFKLGSVDTMEDVLDPTPLTGWPNMEVTAQTRLDRYVAVFFNTADPLLTGLAGKNLRLALTYAVDKARWSHRAIGPFNPDSWAYNWDVKRYDLDQTRARQALAKVEKIPDHIILTTVPAYQHIAEEIKADWEAIGVKTTIAISPEPPPEFTALVIAQQIPVDPDQYNLWHSTQATNLTRIKNPRIDKLLEDGRKTTDWEKRRAIYFELQKYLVEEAVAAFLYHPLSYNITRK